MSVTQSVLYARVAAPNALSTPLALNGVYDIELVSGEITRTRNGYGAGKAEFPLQDGLAAFLAVGRHVTLWITDAVKQAANIDGGRVNLGAFIIQGTEEDPTAGVLRVYGPDLAEELAKMPVWTPIGQETVIATTIQERVPAPWRTVLKVGAPRNNDSISVVADPTAANPWTSINGSPDPLTVVRSEAIGAGDEVRIKMNNGQWHVSTIRDTTFFGGRWRHVLWERFPENADAPTDAGLLAGSTDATTYDGPGAVEYRRRQIKVGVVNGTTTDAIASFVAGTKVVLTMNGSAPNTLTALTVQDPEPNENIAYLDRGITRAVNGPIGGNPGNAVTATNWDGVSTSDVTQIVNQTNGGWTVFFPESGSYQGTQAGTSHAAEGRSVLELLNLTAARTGEFWRLAAPLADGTPQRKIIWRRAPDRTGTNPNDNVLFQRDAGVSSWETWNRAVIDDAGYKRETVPYTRLYPVAGDPKVTLASCTAAALLAATTRGYSVVTSEASLGLWGIPYVQRTGDTEVWAATEPFSHIRSETNKVAEVEAAADQLLKECVEWLDAHPKGQREYFDVSAFVREAYPPGSMFDIQFQGLATYINRTSDSDALVIDKVTYTVGPDSNGRLRAVISVNDRVGGVVRPAPTAARAMVLADGWAKEALLKASAGGTGNVSITATGGSGGADPAHEHTNYLKADGTTALTGNLSVSANVTVDGVDISAHAADADAHHARVTANDNSLEVVSGQSIRLKRPANSGLAVDATGVYLSPGTLTASTTNSLSTNTHSHAVTTTANAKLTVNTILKGDGNGDVTFRYATADKVITPLVEAAGGTVDVNSSLRFLNARTVSTSAGDLTVAPAGNLLLNPAGVAVQVANTAILKSSNYGGIGSPGATIVGWGMDGATGAAGFESITANELRVQAFIADTSRVVVGSETITPSMAVLAEAFTVPAVSSSATLKVEDAPGITGAVFSDNEWVLLRLMTRPGGGLIVANIWGQVSGYSDQPNGVQHWTFTTRSTSDAGAVIPAGSLALSYGKRGDGWWWVTTQDTAGSPYAGISTWSGNTPYDSGSATHWVRFGQLRGLTGQNEWGMRAGALGSRYTVFSDIRSEIHGGRLSLYQGNGGELRLLGFDVQHFRDNSNSTALVANGDNAATNVTTTDTTFYGALDEGYGGASDGFYVTNRPNLSGDLWLALTDPTWTGTTTAVRIRANSQAANLNGDSIRLYAQVFASDKVTPLTGELRLFNATSNNSLSVDSAMPDVSPTATQAQWNGALVRFRWEYVMSSSSEAIRLDPAVPSIAAGVSLPTGVTTGGSGFWVGSDAGTYKLRIGNPTGAGLRWTGTALELTGLRDGNQYTAITLKASGDSEFTGPMTLAVAGGGNTTGGGIWQGAGTFANPTTGLKIWNDGGVGRLATYSGGTEQVSLDTSGRLTAGGTVTVSSVTYPAVALNASGVTVQAYQSASPGWLSVPNYQRSIAWRQGTTLAGYIASTATADNSYRAVQIADGTLTSKLRVSNQSIVADSPIVSLGAANSTTSIIGNLSASIGLSLAMADSAYKPSSGVMNLYVRPAGAHPSHTASPLIPPGSVNLYAINNGAGQTQLILQNASGTRTVLGSVAYV